MLCFSVIWFWIMFSMITIWFWIIYLLFVDCSVFMCSEGSDEGWVVDGDDWCWWGVVDVVGRWWVWWRWWIVLWVVRMASVAGSGVSFKWQGCRFLSSTWVVWDGGGGKCWWEWWIVLVFRGKCWRWWVVLAVSFLVSN